MHARARRITSIFALVFALPAGCARSRAKTEPPPAAAPTVASVVPAREVDPSPAPPAPPEGFVPVTVLDVVPTETGHAVLLVDGAQEVVVPIFVGGTEALSIRLRLDQERYPRPLTHDLLDAVVKELGGRLVKVHVDDLRGGTFVGSVFVSNSAGVRPVDARPSDAIALALGARVPIFMATKVLEKAGIRKDDVVRRGPAGEALTDDLVEYDLRPSRGHSL